MIDRSHDLPIAKQAKVENKARASSTNSRGTGFWGKNIRVE